MNKYSLILAIIMILTTLSVVNAMEEKNTQVIIETNVGNMTLMLYDDKAPLTVNNFKKLISEQFYDDLIFHRVIDNFMIQGGDPQGNGLGGPGYTIKDEFVSELKHDKIGILSMANKGIPNTGGSQFFITLVPTPWLDGKHSVFGEVTQGIEVLKRIGKTAVNSQTNKPLRDIVMKKVIIVEQKAETAPVLTEDEEGKSPIWLFIMALIILIVAALVYYKLRGRKVDQEKEYVHYEQVNATEEINKNKEEEKQKFETFE